MASAENPESSSEHGEEDGHTANEQPPPATQATPEPAEITEQQGATTNCLTVAEKRAVCDFKRKHPGASTANLVDYAKQTFAKSPSTSQIGRVLQDPERWQSVQPAAKKVRAGRWPALEAALQLALLKESNTKKVTSAMILEKARALASEMGITAFTGSLTWAESFKARQRLTEKTEPSVLPIPAGQPVMGLPFPGAVHVNGHNSSPTAAKPQLQQQRAKEVKAAQDTGTLSQSSVSLDDAHQAAFVVATFMEENATLFSIEEQLSFERGIRAKLSKLLIEKFRQGRL